MVNFGRVEKVRSVQNDSGNVKHSVFNNSDESSVFAILGIRFFNDGLLNVLYTWNNTVS